MENSPQTVVRFPSERVPRAAVVGATRFQIWRGRVREMFGRALNRVKIPGAVRDMSLTDELTGQDVSVTVGVLHVRISVDGRDYYFDRLTGHFDGTGSAV